MTSFRLPLMLAMAPLAITPLAAQTVGTQGWYQYSGPDYTVISQMSQADTAEWTGRVNQFLEAMKGRLPGDARVLGPFKLVLFKNDADYWASVPVLQNGEKVRNLAAFSRSGGWGAISATCELGTSEQTQRLFLGTCVDWLLSADHRRRPRALTLGLGEVYGAYVIENGVEVFGRPVRGWTSRLQKAEHHTLGNAETFLRVEDLLAVKEMDPVADVHGVGMFMVESWGFTHFLLFSKEMANQHAMERLLAAFSRHLNPHDALREALGDRADTINARFRDYIRGGDFFEVTAPIVQAPLAGPPTPADPAAVASILGQLEASARHLDVARQYADQAVRLAPNDAGPRETLALVDYLEHRYDEAAADCREAIRLNTRDGWTWFEASEVIGRKDSDDPTSKAVIQLAGQQARDAINTAEKAILFGRGIEAAYSRVAALIPTANVVTEDDGKFMAMGRMLFPNNGWIEIGHAQWAHRVHDDALAQRIIGDVLARPAAFVPEEIEKARALQKEWPAPRG